MDKIKCFYCDRNLTELEISQLKKSYLRVCFTCKNKAIYDSFQIKGKSEKKEINKKTNLTF